MRNSPEWALSFFAAASIGAVVVPLNAWLTGQELEYALADSETAVLIADAERAELLRPYFSKLALSALIVARGGSRPPEGSERLEDVLGEPDPAGELPEVAI